MIRELAAGRTSRSGWLEDHDHEVAEALQREIPGTALSRVAQES